MSIFIARFPRDNLHQRALTTCSSRTLDHLGGQRRTRRDSKLAQRLSARSRKSALRIYQEAIKYLRLSAEQGHAPAQLFLGLVYAAGRGVTRDYNESTRWLRLAANQGNTEAQFYLGGLYFSGTGVPQDYAQAYKWFSLSGKGDPSRASTLEVLARKISPAELAVVREQIQSWPGRK